VREALVSPAAPQKSCPTVTMIRIAFAAQRSSASAVVTIEFEVPPASLMPLTSVAAKTSASSTNQPISPDQNTERHTPCAAVTAAPRVSSAVWAEAS
jgi:hypothetical protein